MVAVKPLVRIRVALLLQVVVVSVKVQQLCMPGSQQKITGKATGLNIPKEVCYVHDATYDRYS